MRGVDVGPFEVAVVVVGGVVEVVDGFSGIAGAPVFVHRLDVEVVVGVDVEVLFDGADSLRLG